MTMVVALISTRNQFGHLLNERGLTGKAVEVGTHRGEFAEVFLHPTQWKGEKMWCVDPWCYANGYEEQAAMLWGGGNRTDDHAEARKRLARYKDKCEFMVMTSAEASPKFPDLSLDFVHLDGNHEPPFVSEDLDLWWPKVRKGGILAGHDFVCPGEPDGLWGRYIQDAVLSFSLAYCLLVHLVVEPAGPWSYYMEKP